MKITAYVSAVMVAVLVHLGLGALIGGWFITVPYHQHPELYRTLDAMRGYLPILGAGLAAYAFVFVLGYGIFHHALPGSGSAFKGILYGIAMAGIGGGWLGSIYFHVAYPHETGLPMMWAGYLLTAAIITGGLTGMIAAPAPKKIIIKEEPQPDTDTSGDTTSQEKEPTSHESH